MVVEPATAPPRTGRMGVSAASLVFEAWGWLFREQPIEDYGIDAHVEPLDGPEEPARQLLALQILQQIATVQGAFAEAFRLGSPPGAGGTALEREAADSQVTVLAAEAAAAMGNHDLAASFAAQATDPAAAAFIGALATDPSRGPAALAAAWRTAVAAATTHEQARRALYQLAAAGQLADADIAAAEGRGSVSAQAIAVLTARNDAANGQADAAVTVLREHRDAYPPAAELLIEVLELTGRTDEALEECDRAITRFGDGIFAHNKLNILARAGRQEEAEAYATSLLASPSALQSEQRIRLRQVLIQHRFDARDFAAAEHMCRDALAGYPDDADFAWALITAQANQGDMDRAAASYQHLHPALSGPELVPLWLNLLSRRSATDADVEEALDAAEQWPGTLAARRLIEGTVAMIAALSPSGGQLQPAAGGGKWKGQSEQVGLADLIEVADLLAEGVEAADELVEQLASCPEWRDPAAPPS